MRDTSVELELEPSDQGTSSSQALLKPIKKFGHPIHFALILFLGIIIGYGIPRWQVIERHSELYLLVLAITILMSSVLKDHLFGTTAVRSLEDMKRTSEASFEKLSQWLITNLSPTIISLETNERVLEQASNIINTAVIDVKDSTNRYIMFVGSGDLYKEPPPESEGERTPLTDYSTAMAQMTSNYVRVIRYISLLQTGDYARRSPQTKADYKKWLRKQISLLERNPNYYLFDCPRAPMWGSSRSSIISDNAVLDVVGSGQSGVLIRGHQVARVLKESSEDLFRKAAVKPIQYTSTTLSGYLKDLEPPSRRSNGSRSHRVSKS
jgi:hypothetical protein